MTYLTKRLEKIKQRLFEIEFNDPGVWHFQDVNILDFPKNAWMKEEAMVVRKAYSDVYVCENLPVNIYSDELIVGKPNQNSVAWGSTIPKYFTKEEGEVASRYELDECSIWGHHPPAYNKLIDKGVYAVKEEVQEKLEKELLRDNPDEFAIDNYRAMMISLDGLLIYAQRYSQEALRLAKKCEDNERRQELYEIHKVCCQVPGNPARNMQEALQAYWFLYAILNSCGEFIPLGRADQYIYPYYQKDIKNGDITEERAKDLMGSFLVKCNERIIIDTKKAENHFSLGLFSQGRLLSEEDNDKINGTGGFTQRALTWQDNEDYDSEANYNYGQSGNDWLMNCMVGGVDSKGKDATNRISYMIIELMNAMDLLMPTLGARVHKDGPQEFIELLATVLRHGQGEPMIYVDDNIIPGFVELGIPIEEARDYCNDGCWETLLPGKSHFSYAHIMNLRCLEWVLFRGKSLHNGAQEGLDTGNPLEFKNYEEFYRAYVKQMCNRIDFQCERRLENLGLSYMIAPDPLFSVFTKDCIEKGKDVTQDGARYIFHLILATGLPNTVDALAAIKKLVYEDKAVTMTELVDALEKNWEGHDRLKAMVENKVPKFGNDDDYADEIAIRVMHDFENQVVTWRKKQNKLLFPCGAGTFENYAVLGRDIGASADGRYFGEQLAANYSPVQGKDKEGPTAVFNSITKPNLLRYYCGTPVDLAINSNEVEGNSGLERMCGIIQSFCELGGQILTITSTNIEELKDAKIHPEKHQNLRVRMGGLSAYFIAMAPAQQDNIITRFSR